MKDKYFNLIMPFIWFSLLVFCVFLFAFTSHAETYDDYYPLHQNANNFLSTEQLEYFDSLFDADNNLIFGYLYSSNNGYNVMVFTYGNNSNNAMMYGEIGNDPRYFNIYRGSGFNYHIEKSYEWTTGDFYNGSSWNINFNQFFSNIDSTKGTFISNFDLYSNNNPDTQLLILNYSAIEPDPDVPIGQGHATPPEEFDNPTLANGSNHTLPHEVPETPTINNYTWITYNPPTIDTTNMESLLESLIYVINYLAGWLRDNLSGEFQNLISNLQDLFDYVVDTIQYYIGLVISNIQNGIDTFYNNMVSLFEPIASAVNYVITPIDSDFINDSFESTNFYSIKTQFTSVFTTFDNAFDIAEPDTFTIIFNVQNITLFYDYGVRSPVTVDLGANFLPIRAALRTFLWVLVSFGSVFVVEHGLSNWIRGERNT